MVKVFILDDDRSLCETMRELLEVFGVAECQCFCSLGELQAAKDFALSTDVAFLDVNLGVGEPSGIDACRWMLAAGFSGKIVFITGHAGGHPELKQLLERPGVSLLHKPVPTEQLRAVVDQIVQP